MSEPKDVTQEQMADMQDELRWDELFKRTQPQLAVAARRARQQIAAGMPTPLDYSADPLFTNLQPDGSLL